MKPNKLIEAIRVSKKDDFDTIKAEVERRANAERRSDLFPDSIKSPATPLYSAMALCSLGIAATESNMNVKQHASDFAALFETVYNTIGSAIDQIERAG